ncbi:MAG TPA: hypothetical protein VMQ61_13370 [Thermoanaerobaculia bacterium]|nr:hypothetical protein [Thermoanaerobaculia bacterium]
MNRLATLSALVVTAALGIRCRDSNSISGPHAQGAPATPTPTATPASAAQRAPDGVWDLTDEVVGDSGPDFCIYLPPIGAVFHGTYTIARSGNTLNFMPEDVVDWSSYIATLQGTTFTASNPPIAESDCARYDESSSLSGSFSADYTRLSATETWSFRLDSGQTKTLTFQWSAVRR